MALVAVNGFEQRLKDEKLQQQDRQMIEAELKAFRAQVGNGVTVKPVTYRNPQSQEDEAGAEVFLEGTTEPLGWISHDHIPLLPVNSTGRAGLRQANTRSMFSVPARPGLFVLPALWV